MVKSQTEKRGRSDWEETALDAMAAGGLSSLAIPDLARTLGVTKGSFYWHFQSLDALIEASLQRWEESDAAAVLELEALRDPRARLREAFSEARHSSRPHALYVSLSASGDKRVTTVLRRISDRRLRFLTAAYVDLGFDRAEAENRAMLAYLAYIGLMHIRKTASPRKLTAAGLEEFIAHAIDTLIPPP